MCEKQHISRAFGEQKWLIVRQQITQWTDRPHGNIHLVYPMFCILSLKGHHTLQTTYGSMILFISFFHSNNKLLKLEIKEKTWIFHIYIKSLLCYLYIQAKMAHFLKLRGASFNNWFGARRKLDHSYTTALGVSERLLPVLLQSTLKVVSSNKLTPGNLR